jgi:hypothetical protein
MSKQPESKTTPPWKDFKWDKSTWVVLTNDFWENVKRLLNAKYGKKK